MDATEKQVELRNRCDNLAELGGAVADIAKILSGLPDSAAARRVLVASGLMTGVYDVSEDWRIVERQRD